MKLLPAFLASLSAIEFSIRLVTKTLHFGYSISIQSHFEIETLPGIRGLQPEVIPLNTLQLSVMKMQVSQDSFCAHSNACRSAIASASKLELALGSIPALTPATDPSLYRAKHPKPVFLDSGIQEASQLILTL